MNKNQKIIMVSNLGSAFFVGAIFGAKLRDYQIKKALEMVASTFKKGAS